jgi:hypothetical protein
MAGILKGLTFFFKVLWAPGCLFWARLNKYLAPFLLWSSVDGPSTLHWRDEMLYNAVKQKYLGDQQRKEWAHQTLVNYYQVGTWSSPEQCMKVSFIFVISVIISARCSCVSITFLLILYFMCLCHEQWVMQFLIWDVIRNDMTWRIRMFRCWFR